MTQQPEPNPSRATLTIYAILVWNRRRKCKVPIKLYLTKRHAEAAWGRLLKEQPGIRATLAAYHGPRIVKLNPGLTP